MKKYPILNNIIIKRPVYKLPKLKPLTQVYRKREHGVWTGLFEDITGLEKSQLLSKLVPSGYLTIVVCHAKTYILKDFYWLTFLEYLKSRGYNVVEPKYTLLPASKTIKRI